MSYEISVLEAEKFHILFVKELVPGFILVILG